MVRGRKATREGWLVGRMDRGWDEWRDEWREERTEGGM